jgi:pimeloyl-ACP methyl ester carboxylesterase
MSTATVARDMVALVDEIHASRDGRRKPPTTTLPQTYMLDQRTDEAKILYLGFSYGTVLGNTFASMFQGRVGGMILDGVENVEDFVQGVRPS